MNTCKICAKNNNSDGLLHQGQNWNISLGPIDSQVMGYLYLEPRRHIENWSEFTQAELEEMGLLIQKAEKAIKSILQLERMYVVTISEAVRHLHLHLVPRLEGSSIRGIPLIESATQCRPNENKLSTEKYESISNDLREQLNAFF